MMKITALSLLAGSAAAFAPAQVARTSTALSAEKSKALPFMNRPPLVSFLTTRKLNLAELSPIGASIGSAFILIENISRWLICVALSFYL
jgi:hypothetical protein